MLNQIAVSERRCHGRGCRFKVATCPPMLVDASDRFTATNQAGQVTRTGRDGEVGASKTSLSVRTERNGCCRSRPRTGSLGHERALVDDRSKATQSLMLARLLESALGPGLQPLVREDPDGDGQASALPYKASMRLHAFSAAGSL